MLASTGALLARMEREHWTLCTLPLQPEPLVRDRDVTWPGFAMQHWRCAEEQIPGHAKRTRQNLTRCTTGEKHLSANGCGPYALDDTSLHRLALLALHARRRPMPQLLRPSPRFGAAPDELTSRLSATARSANQELTCRQSNISRARRRVSYLYSGFMSGACT